MFGLKRKNWKFTVIYRDAKSMHFYEDIEYPMTYIDGIIETICLEDHKVEVIYPCRNRREMKEAILRFRSYRKRRAAFTDKYRIESVR